jgi:large subunit ribosomal protein L19
MDIIKAIEATQLRELPTFGIGDVVKVHFKIVEGKTERIQVYEGTVIAMNNGGIRKTVTVRKISFGVGVERVFPLHSPRVDKFELVRPGRVRRSKLYYLRDRVGKAAKVKELIRKKAVEE